MSVDAKVEPTSQSLDSFGLTLGIVSIRGKTGIFLFSADIAMHIISPGRVGLSCLRRGRNGANEIRTGRVGCFGAFRVR